jgi:hypothetical protein
MTKHLIATVFVPGLLSILPTVLATDHWMFIASNNQNKVAWQSGTSGCDNPGNYYVLSFGDPKINPCDALITKLSSGGQEFPAWEMIGCGWEQPEFWEVSVNGPQKMLGKCNPGYGKSSDPVYVGNCGGDQGNVYIEWSCPMN